MAAFSCKKTKNYLHLKNNTKTTHTNNKVGNNSTKTAQKIEELQVYQ